MLLDGFDGSSISLALDGRRLYRVGLRDRVEAPEPDATNAVQFVSTYGGSPVTVATFPPAVPAYFPWLVADNGVLFWRGDFGLVTMNRDGPTPTVLTGALAPVEARNGQFGFVVDGDRVFWAEERRDLDSRGKGIEGSEHTVLISIPRRGGPMTTTGTASFLGRRLVRSLAGDANEDGFLYVVPEPIESSAMPLVRFRKRSLSDIEVLHKGPLSSVLLVRDEHVWATTASPSYELIDIPLDGRPPTVFRGTGGAGAPIVDVDAIYYASSAGVSFASRTAPSAMPSLVPGTAGLNVKVGMVADENCLYFWSQFDPSRDSHALLRVPKPPRSTR